MDLNEIETAASDQGLARRADQARPSGVLLAGWQDLRGWLGHSRRQARHPEPAEPSQAGGSAVAVDGAGSAESARGKVTVQKWSVSIEATGARPQDCDLAGDLIDGLEGHSPAVSIDARGTVGVTFDVEAADHGAAASEAVRLLAAIAAQLRPVEVRVQTFAEQERELRESNVPELLGVAELAEALGVSRQRVAELAATEDFPRPVARLRAGPVWQRAALGRFLAVWERRPGRPRRPAAT